MKQYQLYASTYESPEQMKAHQVSDIALNISRSSSPFFTSAKTLKEATDHFINSTQLDHFLSVHTDKSVYFYYINDIGEPVLIG